jgi:two-component system response regulator RegX3
MKLTRHVELLCDHVTSLSADNCVVDPEGRPVVLLVEDEASYLDALELGLNGEGFVVRTANSINEARILLSQITPDIVLLDVMLPDGSGIDLCREIRQMSDVPVIMVSARSDEVDIVLGLEFGASDYVTKPFRLRELVARMRAVMRRYVTADDGDVISIGTLRIDPTRRSVRRHSDELDLSRKEFDLLLLLASRLGQVVTREECLDTLWWGQDLSDTRTLDTHVKRLRQKIEQDSSSPVHLKTIRGVGFRLDR